MKCLQCNKKIDEQFMNITLCFVCRQYYCFDCIKKHHHNFYNKKIEYIFSCNYVCIYEFDEIIRKKIKIFQNMIKEYKTNVKDIYSPTIYALFDDHRKFQTEAHHIKERFIYKFVKMTLHQKFCNNIVEYILNFL